MYQSRTRDPSKVCPQRVACKDWPGGYWRSCSSRVCWDSREPCTGLAWFYCKFLWDLTSRREACRPIMYTLCSRCSRCPPQMSVPLCSVSQVQCSLVCHTKFWINIFKLFFILNGILEYQFKILVFQLNFQNYKI